jgi:hypothetical protein
MHTNSADRTRCNITDTPDGDIPSTEAMSLTLAPAL